MITPTKDASVVNAVFREAFADPSIDWTVPMANGEVFALAGDEACMIFTRETDCVYTITFGVTIQGRGKSSGQSFADGVAWMFSNTDGLILRGVMAIDNAAIIALVSGIPGARLGTQNDETKMIPFSIPVARWAIAIGVASALQMLRDGGQTDKATKLASATGGAHG